MSLPPPEHFPDGNPVDSHWVRPDQAGRLYDTQRTHRRGGNRKPADRLFGHSPVLFRPPLFPGAVGRPRRPGKKLHTFTFRQLQENVIHRSHALAISSLLILAALCCFGTGVAVALVYGDSEQHVLDYTFPCPDDPSVIQEQLSAAGFSDTFGSLFEMKVGHIPPAEDNTPRFSMDAVLKALEGLPESEDRDVLLNNFSDGYTPRLIALSGYNQLLAAAGLPEITLSGNEAAVYMDTDFTGYNRLALCNGILDGRPEVQIAGEAFWLTGNVHTANLVVDRSITLALALIVPDEVFERMTVGNYAVYLNAVLSPDRLKGQSLLGAVSDQRQAYPGRHSL